MNSPEGPLFRKGEVLYGLHLARTEIAKRDLALVVEGYTDALALAQAGHPNVVASQGTALTERQLRHLRGLSKNVVLLFDGDAAGAEAALRGVQIAEREGLSVRVAVLPAGLDPADAAIEQPDTLAAVVEGAPSVLTYRVTTQLDAADTTSASGRDAAYDIVREILVDAPASIERAELVQLISGRLRLPAELTADLAPRRMRRPSRDALPQTRRLRLDPASLDEQRLLALAVVEPDALAEVERLGPEAFGLAVHAAAARALLARAARGAPQEGDDAALRTSSRNSLRGALERPATRSHLGCGASGRGALGRAPDGTTQAQAPGGRHNSRGAAGAPASAGSCPIALSHLLMVTHRSRPESTRRHRGRRCLR